MEGEEETEKTTSQDLLPTSSHPNSELPQHNGHGENLNFVPSISVSHVAWRVREVPAHLAEECRGHLLGSCHRRNTVSLPSEVAYAGGEKL